MKVRDLIKKLEDSEARHGPDTEVVLIDLESGCFIGVPISAVNELSEFGDIAYPHTSPDTLPAIILS